MVSSLLTRRAKARPFARLAVAAAALPLGACHAIVLDPSGDVAQQQAHYLLMSTGLMMLIIAPVMLLTVFFAWKYRQSNTAATYEPDWHHSTKIELVVWAAPLAIILALGTMTWIGTHKLDPWRPLDRIDANTPVTAATKPLDVQVVALNWKWLFIYPEQKIATVNELVVPTNRPINFHITSSSMMNSFYVPTMAGMIYAMPGMETKLHAVLNKPGDSVGFSSNYSGAGFSNMRFAVHGVADDKFAQWVDKVQGSGTAPLDRAAYLKLEQPSEKEPVRHFATVEQNLFAAAVNMCVQPGKMCASEMAMIDARGGLGLAGVHNVAMLTYDKNGRAQSFSAKDTSDKALGLAYVKALCSQPSLARAEEAPASRPRPTTISMADKAIPAS